MFITVAVSEDKECLFNPDCMINVLLAAIKKRSNIPKRGNLTAVIIIKGYGIIWPGYSRRGCLAGVMRII